MAYCEQLGWYLHVPPGVRSPKVQRHAWTSPTPTYLTSGLSRPTPQPRRRATLGLSTAPAPQGRAERRARSRDPSERRREARARPRAGGASRGSERLRSQPRGALRAPGAGDRPAPRHAETNATRGAESTQRLRAGRRHRSPASARACGGAAPACALGGQTLAPSRAAALQDRAARASRHPRAKSMPPLAAAHVRLVGAFHVVVVVRSSACGPSGEYRRRISEGSFPQLPRFVVPPKSLLTSALCWLTRERKRPLPHLGKNMWNPGKPCKRAPYSSTESPKRTIEPGRERCYARPFPGPLNEFEDGWSTPQKRLPTASGTPSPAG